MMIRKATLADASELARLSVCLWPSHGYPEMEQGFRALLARPDAACFLAEEGGAGIGFAQCQLRHDYVEGTATSPVGYLEGVYVDGRHRGRGIARQLLGACEGWAREMGCTEFASDCELTNLTSQRFHEKLGFAEAGRIVCYTKKL